MALARLLNQFWMDWVKHLKNLVWFSQNEHNTIETVLEDGNNDSISGNNEEKPLLLQAVSWAGRGLKGNSKNVGG